MIRAPEKQGLYDPRNEHDSCGVGFVANISGEKSNDIIRDGLLMLANLDHRGARGADPLVGDGAGCLIQIPDELLRDWAHANAVTLPQPGDYAVAMCFLPQDAQSREAATARLERFIEIEGQILLGWRDVPTDPDGTRRSGARIAAGDPPGDRCARPAHRRPGRVRAQDPDHPQADPESAVRARREARPAPPRGLLHSVILQPDDRLQGAAARNAGRHLLSRPHRSADQVGARAAFTSASRPTPSPAGSSRTPIASSPTTARSTRFAAT